jgi:BirA family biotin operon repressor/biotin-[acetyl-CoA-carboxylase] ligase
VFDQAEILECTFVEHAEVHRAIPSTQDRARAIYDQTDCPLPALVVAETQSAGRGRDGRPWHSPPGALLLSLALPWEQTLPRTELSLAISQAICDLAATLLGATEHSHQLGIKWPNDVWLDGGKLAGVLIELPHPRGRSPAAIVGLGINANNPAAELPAARDYPAASLIDVLQRPVDLQTVLIDLLSAIDRRCAQLRYQPEQLLRDCQSQCLLTGKKVVVEQGRTTLRGTCRGMNPQGALLVETGHKTHVCHSGTVRIE